MTTPKVRTSSADELVQVNLAEVADLLLQRKVGDADADLLGDAVVLGELREDDVAGGFVKYREDLRRDFGQEVREWLENEHERSHLKA